MRRTKMLLVLLALAFTTACDRTEDSPKPTPPNIKNKTTPPTNQTTANRTTATQTDKPTVLYENDFQPAKLGEVSEDLFVLDGVFKVIEFQGDKCLELPKQRIDAYAVLFGPNQVDQVVVTARIHTDKNRRRYSRFGVGLGGVGGVKLRVESGAGKLTLFNDDLPITHVAYEWPAGKWVRLKLALIKVDENTWRYQGKAWTDGEDEPTNWMIAHETDEQPIEGQASVWGSPYAELPIRFDDLGYEKLPAAAP